MCMSRWAGVGVVCMGTGGGMCIGVLLHAFMPSSVAHMGRMGLLGVRRLAQLKRDEPERFERLMRGRCRK